MSPYPGCTSRSNKKSSLKPGAVCLRQANTESHTLLHCTFSLLLFPLSLLLTFWTSDPHMSHDLVGLGGLSTRLTVCVARLLQVSRGSRMTFQRRWTKH